MRRIVWNIASRGCRWPLIDGVKQWDATEENSVIAKLHVEFLVSLFLVNIFECRDVDNLKKQAREWCRLERYSKKVAQCADRRGVIGVLPKCDRAN